MGETAALNEEVKSIENFDPPPFVDIRPFDYEDKQKKVESFKFIVFDTPGDRYEVFDQLEYKVSMKSMSDINPIRIGVGPDNDIELKMDDRFSWKHAIV